MNVCINRLKEVLLVWMALCFSSFAFSTESVGIFDLSLEDLSEIEISIGAGKKTPLKKVPSTASVITSAEIRAMGARTLDEVIEKIPGVHVSLSPFNRLDSVYSFRGIHTGFNPHVLLMLNNVPVQFSLQGGRPSLFRMPLQYVESIEVIRGPGSAIYGADAYSGVINIVTKNAEKIQNLEGGARTGSFGFRDFWVQGGQSLNANSEVTFNINLQKSDGDNSRIIEHDLQSLIDLSGTNASLAPGPIQSRYQIADFHLNFSSTHWDTNLWSWISRDAGIGVGGASALDPTGHDDSELYLADVSYNNSDLFTDWDLTSKVSYVHYDLQAQFNLLPSGTTVPIGSDGNLNTIDYVGIVTFSDGLIGNPGAQTQDAHFSQVAIFNGFKHHSIRIAAGVRYQGVEGRESKNFGPGVINGTQEVVDGTLTNVTGTPFVFVKDASRTTRYISLQDQWAIQENFELTTGIRLDEYSDFGSTLNPRIALVHYYDKLVNKIMFGSAFRAPSFTEQFNKNNPAVIGNEDLEPEIIDTYEFLTTYQFDQTLSTSLNLFTYKAKDLIEATPGAGGLVMENVRNQDGRGAELSVDWKPVDGLHLSTNYTWQQARDAEDDSPVPYVPQRQFTSNVYWKPFTDWSIQSQLNWVGDRERSATDPRGLIKNYTLIDVNIIRANVVKNLDLGFKVRNLADRDAREPSEPRNPGIADIANDFPLESRSVTFEIMYRAL